MPVLRRLDLVLGPCRWEAPARNLLALTGVVALLAAPSNGAWKLAALAALAATWYGSGRRARADGATTLSLHADGTTTLTSAEGERPVRLVARAWLSRRFCLVEWSELDRPGRGRGQVCASNNDPDDYRRMLGLLRLGAHAEGADGHG